MNDRDTCVYVHVCVYTCISVCIPCTCTHKCITAIISFRAINVDVYTVHYYMKDRHHVYFLHKCSTVRIIPLTPSPPFLPHPSPPSPSSSQFLFIVFFSVFLVTCLRFNRLFADKITYYKDNRTNERDIIFSDLFDEKRLLKYA